MFSSLFRHGLRTGRSSFFAANHSLAQNSITKTTQYARSFSRVSKQRPGLRYISRNTGFLRSLRRNFGNGGYNYRNTYAGANTTKQIIIGLNGAVFLAWQWASINHDGKLLEQLRENFMVSVANMKCDRPWTTITSAFSHQHFTHFAFNMIAFNAYAGILAVLPGFGAAYMTALTIGCAFAGSYGFLNSKNGQFPRAYGLGASGVVCGFAAAATFVMPRAPMTLMFIPVPIPLWAMTGLFFLVDAFYVDREIDSRVGHAAHIGGSIFGAAFYGVFLRRLRRW